MPYFHLMIIAHVLMAGAFTWIYARGVENKPWLGQGLRFGLAVALLTAVPYYLIYFTVQPMPSGLAVKQIVFDTTATLILGAVVAFLYRGQGRARPITTKPGSTSARARNSPRKRCRKSALGAKRLALTFRDGQFGAISGVCNHVGGPLGRGHLDGDFVVCPWHYYKFHWQTGEGEPGYEADRVPRTPSRWRTAACSIEAQRTTRGRLPHEPHPLARDPNASRALSGWSVFQPR